MLTPDRAGIAVHCRSCHAIADLDADYCTSCGVRLAAEQGSRGDAMAVQGGSDVSVRSASRGWLILGALTIACAAVVAVLVNVGPAERAMEVDISLTGSYPSYWEYGNCTVGLPGYEDMASGSSVTIEGENGEFLGSGAIHATNPSGTSYCEYTTVIEAIPMGHSVYTVTLGSGTRGSVDFTAQELDSNDWTASISVGS